MSHARFRQIIHHASIVLAVLTLTPGPAASQIHLAHPFVRGDVNADRERNLTDAVLVLLHLFQGGVPPVCLDAADADDSGVLNLTDAVAVLDHLFRGSGPLPLPSGECGPDPTRDELDCADFPPCRLYEEAAEILGAEPKFRAVEEKQGVVYALDREGELLVFDLSALENAVAFLSIEEATAARSLQLPSGEGLLRNGDVLYAWGGGGLTVLSLVSSLEPAVLTTLQDGSFFNASRNDDLLLVVGRDLTVIYSIAAPDQPRKLSSWSSDESRLVFSCAAAGTIFYQGEFTHPFRSDQVGLRLFDFSEPTQLQPIGFLELPDPPYHLRVLGNRLVGSGDSVALWNITSPREPRPLAAMARKFEGPAVGRVAVVDGERLVTNGVVFDLAGDNLDALERFDPKFTQVDGFPHGGVASGDKIFLPQWQRILVLRRVR